MKFKLVLSFIILAFCVSANFAQTEITIKKKTSIKIPGVEMPKLPGVKNPLENRTSTVYVKGARMRTDLKSEIPGKFRMETITNTIIMQCDKQRMLSFDSKKKSYYLEPFSGTSSSEVKNAKHGGYVTLTGSVTETGERVNLFGYDARHLKQNLTITPSQGACLKETVRVEIEGWYIDVPEFSCPIKRKPAEFQIENNCFDEVVDEFTGAIAGIPVREIKKVKTEGMTVIVEEEAISLTKTPLSDALFEAPADYKAENTVRAVKENNSGFQNDVTVPQPAGNSASDFAPPLAGLQKKQVGEKREGTIRIGIAKPKITTPESKRDPEAGADLAEAVTKSLVESLQTKNVETVVLETDAPEDEANAKGCDYIFYAQVTQKRGGGMFKSMVLMGAATMAGAMIPGVGGLIASTAASVVMGQTMEKAAKAKDEFALDYKVSGPDKNVLWQAGSKKKAEKDGEDVLTPQLQQASKAILDEIAKKIQR